MLALDVKCIHVYFNQLTFTAISDIVSRDIMYVYMSFTACWREEPRVGKWQRCNIGEIILSIFGFYMF